MKYKLNAILSNDTYTLTGNDADASFNVSTEHKVDFYCGNLSAIQKVFICGMKKLKVTKARISNSGLPVVGSGRNSASLLFRLREGNGVDDGNIIASFSVNIRKWGEWEDKDIVVEQDDANFETSLNSVCTLYVTSGTAFHVYDYNIQEDLVGQDIVPIIELEIECDKIVDFSGNAI